MTSSLFPQLSPGGRRSFGVALLILVAVLVGLALLRWQAPMIAIAAFGLTMLFGLYVWQIRLGVRDVVVTVVVGLGLGVGWAVVVGPIVAQAYGAALGSQTNLRHVLVAGIAVPISGALLMVVPALVVRALDRRTRAPLKGFAIGALGASVFNSAATATLLMPQLAMGVVAHDQSATSLLAEAIVEGLAWAVSCLAVGGIFGIALWRSATGDSRRHRRVVAMSLAAAVVVVTALGLVDIAPLPLRAYIAAQLLIAMVAVIALRKAIAAATQDDAVDAASPNTRPTNYVGVLVPLVTILGIVAATGVGTSALITPAAKAYVCPPDCGRPPLGTPVETNPRYSGDGGAFSVAYPDKGSAYDVSFDPGGLQGVELTYTGGDTGTMLLFGEHADGRDPRQIVEQVLRTKYPDASVSYEIPNASVGYQPGYGVIADVYSRDSAASFTRLRVIVMAAVKHDYALIAAAVGPYHEFSPDYGTGHPSGANMELAMDMGKYVNSFRWSGDRYGRRP